MAAGSGDKNLSNEASHLLSERTESTDTGENLCGEQKTTDDDVPVPSLHAPFSKATPERYAVVYVAPGTHHPVQYLQEAPLEEITIHNHCCDDTKPRCETFLVCVHDRNTDTLKWWRIPCEYGVAAFMTDTHLGDWKYKIIGGLHWRQTATPEFWDED